MLGAAAEEYIDKLERRAGPRDGDAELLAATEEEQKLGLCSPPMTREDVDRKFGVGQWRPLPRHPLFQHGKCRPIDDGKASGENQATALAETISRIGPVFPIVMIRCFSYLDDEPLINSLLQRREGVSDEGTRRIFHTER